MCIAIPGKVTAIDGSKAKADFSGNAVSIHLGLVDAAVGDYVLVHAGCAIEVLTKERAEEMLSLLHELEELGLS